MGSRRIDAVDTLWLNMDRSNNLMVIESLMTLAGPVDWDRFLDVVHRRVLDVYPVFTQRAVTSGLPLLAPHWEDDPDFTLARHVHRVTLPAPGDDLALQRYVDEHLTLPLPRDRPLWELHLVDGFGDGAAVYSRLHHAMADGIALTQVLLSLTDGTADGESEPVAMVEQEHLGPLVSAAHVAGVTATALLDAPRLLTISRLGEAAEVAWQSAGVASKLLFSRRPASPVSGRATVTKRAILAPPIGLDDIAAAGHRTGTTVNDVLMAALAGALTSYLVSEHGNAVDIPTMVPVNLRPLDEPLPPELGNEFALVLFSLPSGVPTPFGRLAETKRRMDAIKGSPEAFLTMSLIRGIGRTGTDLERMIVDFFANKATGVTTNVPGPREPRYLAGTRITGMLGWVPESGDQTLGTSIFTYDHQVFVGFKVDTGVIAHPEHLVSAFVDEVDALCRLVPEG